MAARANNRDLAEGLAFRATPDVVQAVNAAIALRRPLLVTGRTGAGKSALIQSVARELMLGPVFRWNVTSSARLNEALYTYDALGRLHDFNLRVSQRSPRARRGSAKRAGISAFLQLGPLGSALVPRERPRALLVDEIDKSSLDLPNDLLDVFERGEFVIPELARMGQGEHWIRLHQSDEAYPISAGLVQCLEFPFVVLTSNGERDFPSAFLRRCIRLRMPEPDRDLLVDIVSSHLGRAAADDPDAEQLIDRFSALLKRDEEYATDQLLNAVFLVTREAQPRGEEWAATFDLLLKELRAD